MSLARMICEKAMKMIGNAFIDSHEVSAQEAVFTCLGIHQCQASVAEIYVNTSPADERTRVLKSRKDLMAIAETDSSSTDIYRKGILQHYEDRPEEMENWCLADFATSLNIFFTSQATTGEGSETELESDEDTPNPNRIILSDTHSATVRRRRKILRHRRYNVAKDGQNFMRENVMLYVPWRNEARELVNADIAKRFGENQQVIAEKSNEYNKINYEELLEAMNVAMSIEEEEHDFGEQLYEKADDWILDEPDQELPVKTFADDDDEGEGQKFSFVKNPLLITDKEFHDLVAPFNCEQREIFYHYVHNLRRQVTDVEQPKMYIFVTGAAGVGKSRLIRAMTQASIRIINRGVDIVDINSAKLLLCAPTGKAAYNIGGYHVTQRI